MILSKFLDPKNDICFRRIFGTERNKDILVNMLNNVLVLNDNAKIMSLSFLKTSQDPDIAYKKQSIVDILCQNQMGDKIIIEMQVARQIGFEKRAQYYAAKAYSSQMNAGDEYSDLKRVIFLAFTNHIMFPNKRTFKSDHVILDQQTQEHDLKDFSFTFVELPKFKKSIDELVSHVDRWIYFFKHGHETQEEDLERIVGPLSSIRRAYEELNQFNWSEAERLTYDQEVKRVLDNQAAENFAQQQARLEGKTEGIEAGRIEIAKQLLAIGMDIKQVEIITKLTSNKLQQLYRLIKIKRVLT